MVKREDLVYETDPRFSVWKYFSSKINLDEDD